MSTSSSTITTLIPKFDLFDKHSQKKPLMWTTLAKQAAFKTPRKTSSFLNIKINTLTQNHSFLGVPSHESIQFRGLKLNSHLGFGNNENSDKGYFCPRSYVSVAESASCSTSTDVVEEEQEQEQVNVVEEIKGLLLKEFKREDKKETATLLRKNRQLERGMADGKYHMLRRRQVKIETEAWEQAAREYREMLTDMCEQKLAPNLPYMKSLFLGWFEPLRDAISKEQELYRLGKRKTSYSSYFDQLPADMMAVITMHKLMGLLMTDHGCARVVQAACTIGEAIEQEASAGIHRFMEKTKKKKKKAGKSLDDEQLESGDVIKEQDKLRKKVTLLIKRQKLPAVRQILKGEDDAKPWGQDAKAKVGSRLIELLMETAYIQAPGDQISDVPPDVRPAFQHTLRTAMKETKKTTRRYGVIECDPLVRKGMERSARHMVMPYMPMLVPPVKWTGYDKGAHLFLPSFVMRTHGSKLQREAIKNASRKQLEPVFEALDTLGGTKWRINKRVLSIVDRIWNSGGRLADLVDRNDVPLPEMPDTEDEVLLKKWRWKVQRAKKENRERHSQRCDIELKLAVARKMKEEEGFYYPHNVDFRGRAYPMHPYLNHLGSDLCRGILEFAEGRPLGKAGLCWLKIHLANLYAGGVDKLSLDGRLAFTESHLDEIFDSADKPLEGKRWWLNAEDPFQFLSVCITLTEALRSSSPESFVSHTPVHQDGSCNGLQHYAALGRDKLGASAVNLMAAEKPADVYSGIAARVLDIMQEDAQQDPAVFPDALRARTLISQSMCVLGGQKIGEANSDDICIWRYLCGCSGSNQ
ncbi:hypothetical protein ACFE04_010179 [Oxalis oulophora]